MKSYISGNAIYGVLCQRFKPHLFHLPTIYLQKNTLTRL